MVHAEKEARNKCTVQPRACRYASAHIWFPVYPAAPRYMSAVVGLASNIPNISSIHFASFETAE